MSNTTEWTDLLADFMSYTEDDASPDIFRRWSAISMIAGALERRVWAPSLRHGASFPNLYVLLMASPGVGKFVIDRIHKLWTSATEPNTKLPAFCVAPDSMTKASLMDTLAKSKRVRLVPRGPAITYHSLLIAAEEFSVLLPAYDNEYLGALNSIYNIKDTHKEVRRTGSVRELNIENPLINILGGYQPALMATTFPEEAWASGYSRRLIMVHSSETPYKPLFGPPRLTNGLYEQILRKLGHLSQLFGETSWEPAAAEYLGNWDAQKGPPIPSHSKLVHYNKSRTHNAIKLSIISLISRTGQVGQILLTDVKRAIEWLTDAEQVMPDIFREMIGKSDSQVIDELHYFVQAMWAKDHHKPVAGGLIWQFLKQRVPSDKIEKILMVAEKSNVIVRVAGTEDLWLPRPRYEHGVE